MFSKNKRHLSLKKKGQQTLIEANVDHFSHDCRGIARIEGKTTFIEGALPGEVVKCQYHQVKRHYNDARLVEVLQASVDRVEPVCSYYASCGGCSLQHLDINAQIKSKQVILLDALKRIGQVGPEEILPILTSESKHYRSKARLSLSYSEKKQHLKMGFRAKANPRIVVDIDKCTVLHQKASADLPVISQMINALESINDISHLEIAAGDTEIALVLRHLSTPTAQDYKLIETFASQHQYKIYIQSSHEKHVPCLYPKGSDDYLTYALPQFELTLNFHPKDFTQVNPSLNRLMVAQAIQLLEANETDHILDLFCGLGNFSLPLARQCARVIGIEGSQEMVSRAQMNAKLNHLKNVAFDSANLDDTNEIAHVLKTRFNKVLIDPPRSGALNIVKQIGKVNPERIVYVSCNPVTLARDSDILVNQHGYHLKTVGVMDMFPHTSHVESMALFVKPE